MVDPTENAKKALIGELIKAAADNPDVREAGRELGLATLIVVIIHTLVQKLT
jgi:hypothetical protein